jgi:DNA-binding winged helix-turn-helix (wHTH) protein
MTDDDGGGKLLYVVAGDERLLDGEDPQSVHPEDARHWINIYSELLVFKHRLLARIEQDIAVMSSTAQSELSRTEVSMIQAQRKRYDARLAFWYQRHTAMTGLDLDTASRTLRYREHVVILTARESQLLDFLLQNPDNYFVARVLAKRAWRRGDLSAEQVRGYIARLRAVLRNTGAPCTIATFPRRGYALRFDGDANGAQTARQDGLNR